MGRINKKIKELEKEEKEVRERRKRIERFREEASNFIKEFGKELFDDLYFDLSGKEPKERGTIDFTEESIKEYKEALSIASYSLATINLFVKGIKQYKTFKETGEVSKRRKGRKRVLPERIEREEITPIYNENKFREYLKGEGLEQNQVEEYIKIAKNLDKDGFLDKSTEEIEGILSSTEQAIIKYYHEFKRRLLEPRKITLPHEKEFEEYLKDKGLEQETVKRRVSSVRRLYERGLLGKPIEEIENLSKHDIVALKHYYEFKKILKLKNLGENLFRGLPHEVKVDSIEKQKRSLSMVDLGNYQVPDRFLDHISEQAKDTEYFVENKAIEFNLNPKQNVESNLNYMKIELTNYLTNRGFKVKRESDGLRIRYRG